MNSPKEINELRNIFDSLYTRFVLRDLFAKVVPGLIILFGLSLWFISSEQLFTNVSSISFWFWLLLVGLAWFIGFTGQTIGHIIRLIDYDYPKEKDDEMRKKRLQFGEAATSEEKQQYERLVVIKEATGNGSMALIISFIVLMLGLVVDTFTNSVPNVRLIFPTVWHIILVFLVIGLSMVSLYSFYRRSKSKQHKYIEQVLDHKGDK